MMHKAWSSIEELPYCFSRSSVNFQGHIALKIVEFDPNWAFPDCNSSLNAPMAMKCCTKLETAKKRCPIVFQGHPSDFKVTGDKTSPILTQIRHFRTIGRSQLSNPSDLPCYQYNGNDEHEITPCAVFSSLSKGFPGDLKIKHEFVRKIFIVSQILPGIWEDSTGMLAFLLGMGMVELVACCMEMFAWSFICVMRWNFMICGCHLWLWSIYYIY